MSHKSKSEALAETAPNGTLQAGSDTRGMTRMTAEAKIAFCAELEKTANVAAACRLIGVSRQTAYMHKRKDPQFAAMWHEAREAACDALEQALHARGTEGYERTIYYKGQPCGTERIYDTTAAIFMLKGRRPEIFAQGPQGHPGTVNVQDNRVQITGLSDEVLEAAVAKHLGKLGAGGQPGLGGELRHGPERSSEPPATIEAELEEDT